LTLVDGRFSGEILQGEGWKALIAEFQSPESNKSNSVRIIHEQMVIADGFE
jgi:hypothetical protein